MKLVDLKFQPGIDKQDTAYSAGDQRKYVDSDFVSKNRKFVNFIGCLLKDWRNEIICFERKDSLPQP